jgi:hypothetical protein
MSDRIKGFYVALEKDMTQEAAELIKAALYQIRGVINVEASVVSFDDWTNRSQIRSELGKALIEVLYPDKK